MPRASDEGRRGNEGMNLLRRLGGAVVKVRGDDLLRRAQGVGVLGWTLLAVPAVVVALAVGNLVIGLLAVVVVLPLATVATWRTTGPRLAERVLWLGVTLLVGFFFAAAGKAFAAVMAPGAIFTNGDDLLFFAGGYALAAGARPHLRRAVVLGAMNARNLLYRLASVVVEVLNDVADLLHLPPPIRAGIRRLQWLLVGGVALLFVFGFAARALPPLALLGGVVLAMCSAWHPRRTTGTVRAVGWLLVTLLVGVFGAAIGTLAGIFAGTGSAGTMVLCTAGGLLLATAADWPTTDARGARVVWWLSVPPAVVAALLGAFLLYYFGFATLIVLWGSVAASCAAGGLALAMMAVWVRVRDTAPSLPHRLALLAIAALLGAFGLALTGGLLDSAFVAYCAAGGLALGTLTTWALYTASARNQRVFQRNLVYLLAGQIAAGIVIVLVVPVIVLVVRNDDFYYAVEKLFQELAYLFYSLHYALHPPAAL